ncbi:MAG: ferredoxin [Candidatus Dojkabacteria bacterium]|nr:ferredoxin [Candidatus Dojkabacteria bacterium]
MEANIICRYKVDKNLCVPAMTCIAVEPELYILDDDGKAIPNETVNIDDVVAKSKDGEWVEVLVTEQGLERLKKSAMVCPVLAIIVEKYENGTWVRIYPED